MSGPRHMSRMIPDVAGKALGKKGLGYGKLVTDWKMIVGPDLGDVTAPVKLAFPKGERTDATLTIDIVPARAIEVQHSMPQLIERVNAMFGYRAVARIKIASGFLQPAPPIPRAITIAIEERAARKTIPRCAQSSGRCRARCGQVHRDCVEVETSANDTTAHGWEKPYGSSLPPRISLICSRE